MRISRLFLASCILVACATGVTSAQTPASNQAMKGVPHDADAPQMLAMMSGCPMDMTSMRGHGGMMNGQGGMAKMASDPAAMEKQMKDLKTSMGLRANQMGAWDAYAKTVVANAQSMTVMRASMMGGGMQAHDHGATMSTADRMKTRSEMMRTRADALGQMSSAASVLYGILDATQKGTFDKAQGGLCGQMMMKAQ